jgi:hypothetical protein
VVVRAAICLTILMALTASLGCNEAPPAKPVVKAPEAKPAKKAEPAPAPKVEKTNEIVFDPRKPPAGFVNCHRNHCHRVGGGVASYAQVMEEIGATKIIGVPKRAPMPPAPSDVGTPPSDATVTASGLAYKVLKPGDGKRKPGPGSVATVHYTGWTASGKGFDSSISRGKPANIPIDRVFPGWTEGLQTMSIGEEKRFWIPQNLAFNGQKGKPTGTLTFDVELIDFR